MKMKKDELAISILLPLAVGAVSGYMTRNAMMMFDVMNKPPLSPPGWLFPVVWTILYILMGIASYMIYREGWEAQEVRSAITTYLIQLVFNFFWSIIFFQLKWYLFAFVWLVVMWMLIVKMLLQFRRINVVASNLIFPYLFWTSFAAYLNFGVYLLN